MVLAALALLAAPPTVWRSYEEVFALAADRSRVYAGTDGGVLALGQDGAWTPLANSPADVRGLKVTSAGLLARLGDGRLFLLSSGSWKAAGQGEIDTSPPQVSAPAGSGGTRLATISPDGIYSFWNAKQYYRRSGSSWQAVAERPPVPVDYSVLRVGNTLLAGTRDGLWSYSNGWTREPLPSQLPFSGRVEGIAQFGNRYLVGGSNGLYIGSPNGWEKVNSERVRQIVRDKEAAWVMYGNGAVDKLVPSLDRLYDDILYGGTKRPWTGAVSLMADRALFGGHGGWMEKSRKRLEENYPDELKGDVVTAIYGRGNVRWIGTQKLGLFRFDDARKRFLWNPGNGLTDCWVTSLVGTKQGIVVGTQTRGLFLQKGFAIATMKSPTKLVRCLAMYRNRLVVGGMDGAWIQEGPKWRALDTRGEETTSLTVDGRLVVTTNRGVFFF